MARSFFTHLRLQELPGIGPLGSQLPRTEAEPRRGCRFGESLSGGSLPRNLCSEE